MGPAFASPGIAVMQVARNAIAEAIAFMEDKNMNIAEVTMATGFSSASYFTKCFRKRFGKVPSDYMVAN